MAQGSNYLTTYYAKRIIGDNAAANAADALLQTGANIAANTWILHRTNRSQLYGIRYLYDSSTSTQEPQVEGGESVQTPNRHDKIEFYGGYAPDSTDTPTAWIQLDVGNLYILGKAGFGALPDGTHQLYVFGMTKLEGNVGIGADAESGYKLYVYGASGFANGHLYFTGSDATSSTGNTTQLIFGTPSAQHIALTSNAGAFIINPTSGTTTGQIVLVPNGNSYITTGTFSVNTTAQSTYTLYVNGTGYFTDTITAGARVTSTSPSALSSVNRIIITPYFHTGGPWYIKSEDDASNAHISLYYSTSKLIQIRHNGYIMAGDSVCVTGSSWASGTTMIGKNGTDKVIIGYLASSTNGAVVGAHASTLQAWAPLNISGSQVNIRGQETVWAKWLDGCLSLFPTSNNYREGLRIHSYSNWSDITLCGNDNTGDTGISANSWFIGNNNGNFYIARNGSPGTTAYLSCVSNAWTFLNKVRIASTEDVNLGANGALIIGATNSTNIGIDDNEIMARNNSAASTLYINSEGGQVYVGSGGIYSGGDVALASGKRVHASGGALYLGNSNNASWVYVQDIASQDASKWKLHTSGAMEMIGRLWIQGGSEAGSNTNRLTTTAGMPGDMTYNASKRGLQLYANGIAFADPYNGNSNNDSAWIRHIEETANSGYLEIATGDDSNEPIYVRQYNTSNAVARTLTLLNASGYMLLPSYINVPTNNNENPSVSQFIVTNGTDHYYRKASVAHAAAAVDGQHKWVRLAGDTMTGLLTLKSGSSHTGVKIGDTYITAINGEVIFQNNTSIRFGTDSWDWNCWAELGYIHSSKNLYLGLAGSPYSANATQTGGTLNFPGIRYITGNGKRIFDLNDSWLRINEDSAYSSGIYFGSGAGGTVRTDNQFQVGSGGSKFYANSGGNVYGSGAFYCDGSMNSHTLWANRGSGERQCGVTADTSGNLYFYSNGSSKGIYSGSGYRTGGVITINSSSTTFYGTLSGHASSDLALSGGTMTGTLNVTTVTTTNRDGTFNIKCSSAVSGGPGWADLGFRFLNNAGTKICGMGCYGTALTNQYMYIGYNAHSGNNLRILPDGKIQSAGHSTISSRTIKHNIVNMTENEAKKILKLQPVSFDYNKEWGGATNQFGLIAEDVQQIIPSVVFGKDPIGIDYSKLTAHLIKFAQIQQREINDLRSQLQNCISQINFLKKNLEP